MSQPNVSDVDVEIPQDAIRRMGVGFFRPIEGHLLADREELCSTQVEPSTTSELQASAAGATNAPNHGQTQDPPQADNAKTEKPDYPGLDNPGLSGSNASEM